MEENNTENIIKNIDKIKMLSGMLGQDGSMDAGKMENIINAITTAKKLGIINMPQEESHDIAVSENTEQDNSSFGEGIRAIKAAIPFLNREYQKHLFLAVKLMEMNKEYDDGKMSLQCQSITEGTSEEQREAMLRAVRGQLGSESGRKLDVILKMLEARRIADRLK